MHAYACELTIRAHVRLRSNGMSAQTNGRCASSSFSSAIGRGSIALTSSRNAEPSRGGMKSYPFRFDPHSYGKLESFLYELAEFGSKSRYYDNAILEHQIRLWIDQVDVVELGVQPHR